MMFVSPTFARKLLTISSKRSWPTSTQSVWRIVLVLILLSPSLETSSGGRAFSIRLAAGVLWTGTRRCISTLAAAEEAMGFTGWASTRGRELLESGRGGPERSGSGMTIDSPQEGQF